MHSQIISSRTLIPSFSLLLSCPQYDKVTISQACWEQKRLKMLLARSTVEVIGRAHTQSLWHLLPSDRAEKTGEGGLEVALKEIVPLSDMPANLCSRGLYCSELGSVCACVNTLMCVPPPCAGWNQNCSTVCHRPYTANSYWRFSSSSGGKAFVSGAGGSVL